MAIYNLVNIFLILVNDISMRVHRGLLLQKGQQEDIEASLQTHPGSRGKVTGFPENIDMYK